MSKLSIFNDDDDDTAVIPAPTSKVKGGVDSISTEKLTTFVYGRQKKSQFQMKKEAAEAKKKKEQEEAAAVYDSFVASFEGGGNASGPSFVRGGVTQDGKDLNFSDAGKKYNVNTAPKILKPATVTSASFSDLVAGLGGASNAASKDLTSGNNIDLSSIKKKSAALALINEITSGDGSHDSSDANTCNIFVSNIASTVTEDVLFSLFGKYGKIESVKIMWPRGDQLGRKRNTGFVSFDKRAEAVAAMDGLQGEDVHGAEIRLGWGKAMAKAPQIAVDVVMAKFGLPQAETSFSGYQIDKVLADCLNGYVLSPEELLSCENQRIHIEIPSDALVRKVIDRMAEFVSRSGEPLEYGIRQREGENPVYSFLKFPDSPDALYYRWRVYSLLQGDTFRNWNETPFQMFVGGAIFEPPSILDYRSLGKLDTKMSAGNNLESRRSRSRSRSRSRDRRAYSDDDDDESRNRRKREREREYTSRRVEKEKGSMKEKISREDRSTFRQLLRGITMERDSICEIMCFAMERAEAAEYLVNETKESIIAIDVTAPLKIARLYLISDLLHNSGAVVRNASMFRTYVMASIPEIFENLRSSYHLLSSRLTANTMLEKVQSVLKAWESWSIFSDAFLFGLEATMTAPDPSDEEIATELKNNSDIDELHSQCKLSGISTKGSINDIIKRLGRIKKFNNQRKPFINNSTVVIPENKPETEEQEVVETKALKKNIKKAKNVSSWAVVDIKDEADNDEDSLDGEVYDSDGIDGVPYNSEDDN